MAGDQLALRAVGRKADDDDAAGLKTRYDAVTEGCMDDILPEPERRAGIAAAVIARTTGLTQADRACPAG